ncbi:MAG: energy-coupling factor transporter transmembrane protein EcfT [Nitrososphaerota archaeon]|jgi:energy-coupling factor transport system permease protein|nr:energy-coupling factor transporter transmembrane protein EcfT [Nitrososphaerota archaeon]MDG6926880.1 energy-coupling factor transporter transmembrane protein EcfT [Nitrososphaerota archaeon]MDG6930002.1 energy-coupling factor transporter transmembrane protein EcfT [Nitrososphaerota archaeon]MDG6931953.1 energy-coupling factor transporter transmembrane protein EcfT [Nitrososphaerota archaeon]MDG6943844.1 energy-coupling factor transporter transmembrane protein EcfT [Nitrososphaerota archaeon
MEVVEAWVMALVLITLGPALTIYLIWKIIGFRGYMSLFQFVSGKSFLYKIDPRTKILLAVVLTTIGAITIWYISLIFLVVLLLMYIWTTDPVSKYRIVLPLTLATFIGTAWTEGMFTPPETLALLFGRDTFLILFPTAFQSIGAYGFSTQGIFYGLQIAFRASTGIASGFLLVFTSSPSDILVSLEKSKIPVEIGFGLIVGITSIPKILESTITITDAARARGFDFTGSAGLKIDAMIRRFFEQMKIVILIIASIVIWTLKGAQNIAISADIRGFRAMPKRTYYNEPTIKKSDIIAIIIILAVFAIGIYLSGAGFGPLAYNP